MPSSTLPDEQQVLEALLGEGLDQVVGWALGGLSMAKLVRST